MPDDTLIHILAFIISIIGVVFWPVRKASPKPKPPPTIEDCREMLKEILNGPVSADEKRKAGVLLDTIKKL